MIFKIVMMILLFVVIWIPVWMTFNWIGGKFKKKVDSLNDRAEDLGKKADELDKEMAAKLEKLDKEIAELQRLKKQIQKEN